ncbi:MAG: 5-deoxy-glucuronate isomerase [Clostridiales Family XIII bacterium]|nr:5-deoxy-glucuronate isomerase [Clostridiales Family XIII bacterium]
MAVDKKVFGYPEYDANGEMILSTYDNAYRDMLMDVRNYKLQAGDVRTIEKAGEEVAVLLYNGDITVSWNDKEENATRTSVFEEGPYALHVPKGTKITVKANAESEILVQATQNEGDFDAKWYTPADAPWGYSSKGLFGDTALRRVNTLFDYNTAPYSNMVLGEVLNDRGNWSGYIPHDHPQPELYYFLFDREEGFGASFVGDDVFKSTHKSFSAIPGGKVHPQVCAPGYMMYTCWMIRHLDGNPWTDRIDDPRFTWLYDVDIKGNEITPKK